MPKKIKYVFNYSFKEKNWKRYKIVSHNVKRFEAIENLEKRVRFFCYCSRAFFYLKFDTEINWNLERTSNQTLHNFEILFLF